MLHKRVRLRHEDRGAEPRSDLRRDVRPQDPSAGRTGAAGALRGSSACSGRTEAGLRVGRLSVNRSVTSDRTIIAEEVDVCDETESVEATITYDLAHSRRSLSPTPSTP